jgi:hypothetical protein
MSRTSTYTPELAETICERLEQGESLAAICRGADMPTVRTVLRWADERQDFADEYARARAAAGEYLDDQINEIQKLAVDKDTAQAARVRITALQWRASKQAPRKYGDRLDLQVTPDFDLANELQQRRNQLAQKRGELVNGTSAVHLLGDREERRG